MATYLLLRNNKEQGPLSLQHLIQLGLKPYDLVWVEGKSAAWRYPSEIPELKPYAAAVEEQPFDRFYKKHEEKPEERETPVIQFPDELKEEKIIKEEPVRKQPVEHRSIPDIVFPDDEQYQQYKPQVEKQEEKSYPRKTVYVTMPLQPMHEPRQELKQEPVYKRQEPVFNLQSYPIDDTYEEPVSLNTKYSQPLDEIKEMYVQKLQDRKKQSAQKKFVIAAIKKAAVVIGIISIGVLIGFAIKPKGSTAKLAVANTVQQKTETTQDESIPDQRKESLQKGKETPTHILTEKNSQQEKPKKKLVQETQPANEVYKPVETKPIVSENKKAVMPKQKPAEEKNDEPEITQNPGVDVNASTGERSKKTRTNSGIDNNEEENREESNSSSKGNDIRDMVSIRSNDYYVVAFGGIRNLQLTVLNDSKYVLDKVTVKVDYVRPNGATFKSDNIQFKGVSANGSSTIRMPDTNRGVKVYYKIVKVESKEFKNDMAGL
jgi:hypothetical protein